MQPAPDTSRSPSTQGQSGAGSASPFFDLAAARAVTAIELRHAGSLRRDAAAGRLPRGAAISAIRSDGLRQQVELAKAALAFISAVQKVKAELVEAQP